MKTLKEQTERVIASLTDQEREVLKTRFGNVSITSLHKRNVTGDILTRDTTNDEPARRGEWMQTSLNNSFWPLDPRASEVFIEDIAHSLSMQCRFAGHCKNFYSVGEHSVRVSRLLGDEGFDIETQFAGLLHDAAEAYLVDLPRPVKRHMSEYGPIEEEVSRVIWEKFNIQVACDDPRIKKADEVLLATEKRDLMGPAPRDWKLREEPTFTFIKPMTSEVAEAEFTARYLWLDSRRRP